MNNNSKKHYILLLTILVVWLVITFFIVNPSLFKNVNASISDLKSKNNIFIIGKDNTKSSLINKTGESSIRIFSNDVELGSSQRIKTGDKLLLNNTNYSIAVLGDVNKDGIVNVSDMSRTYSIWKNIVTNASDAERIAADANEDNVINLADVSKIYGIFKGFSSSEPSSGGSSNPDPTPVNYTISFNSEGGSTISSITKQSGESIGTLPTPIRTGYTFAGWYTAASGGIRITSSTKVTGNATYHAQWTLNSYTVTFNSNGGTSTPAVVRTHGQTVGTLPHVTRDGYTFNGWYTAASGGSKISASTQVLGNVTYYAQWTIKTFTVTFAAQGGSAVSSVKRNYNQAIGTLPTTTQAGYQFLGWFTKTSGGTKLTTTTKITDNVTYYAQWKGNSYNVIYNYNYSGAPSNYKAGPYTYGHSTFNLGAPEERRCYKLVGWAKSANGAKVYNADQRVSNLTTSSSITLYAKWEKADDIVKNGVIFEYAGIMSRSDGFCQSGTLKTGWVQSGGNWYFVKKISNTASIEKNSYREYTDGYYYWLDANGVSGSTPYKWEKTNGKWWFHAVNNTNDYEKGGRAIINKNKASEHYQYYGFDSSGWCTNSNDCSPNSY